MALVDFSESIDSFIDARISLECMQTNCGDYMYSPICIDTIQINNQQTQNGNGCTPYPNLQPIKTFYWQNSTQDTLNYIIFSPTIKNPEKALRLDNIVVTQYCHDPDFSFTYLENCKEVGFTSFDTSSANVHLWLFGDDSTSTEVNPIHLFADADTFLVSHVLSDACGNSDTSQLNVIINNQENECCPDTTISVNTIWDSNTVLPGDGRFHTITVMQGVSLTIEDDIVLEFCEGGALQIENGAYVDLQGTLTSYGDMSWKGVYVQGDTSEGQHIDLHGNGFNGLQQGMFYSREGSMIKNAKTGIRNYGLQGFARAGGMIRCEGTTFANNTVAVEFGPYQNINSSGQPVPSLGSFRDCIFYTDSNYYHHEPFFGFARLYKADGMRFAGCDFKNNLLPELPTTVGDFGFGIHAVSAGFEVYAIGSEGGSSLCEYPCVVSDSSRFAGLGHGIYVLTEDKMRLYSIYQTQFENCFRGITSIGTTGGTILFNTIKMGDVPDTDFSYGQIGVELHFDHEGFELQENIFKCVNEESTLNTIGILANALGGNDNFIRRNTFIGIETANQAFGLNADLTPDIQRGLVYLCNTSDSTLSQGYDFHIPNRPAKDVIHPFQTPGAPSGDEISAGNHFAYTAQDFMNFDIDTVTYYYYALGLNEQPRDSFSLKIKDVDSDENECQISYCPPPCLDVEEAKDDFFEGIDDIDSAIDLYVSGIETNNILKINSGRSKALYFQKVISKAAYNVVTHTKLDTLDYSLDSLITWLAHMDTYGADLLIAGEYASQSDFESGIDMLETIHIRRAITDIQEKDIENLIEMYSILDSKPIASFTSNDRSSLRSIAYSNIGYSSAVARALLSRSNEYIPLPYYIGAHLEFRSVQSNYQEKPHTDSSVMQLKIYPNPASEKITVEYNSDKFSSANFVIINILGETIISRKSISIGFEEFDTSTWEHGIYQIILHDELGQIALGKAVILKD